MIICIAPLLLGGLLAGGSALISSIGGAIQGLINRKSVNDTNRSNMELAKYNWQQQKQMWNENNEYNSPKNQMQRLQEAGLNPNLVYGHGSVANTSSGTPTPQLPTMQAYTGNDISNSFNSVSGVLSEYYNIKQAEANIAKTNQETLNLSENNALLRREQLHKDIQNSIAGLNFAKTKEEAKLWYEKLRADIDKVTSSTVLDNANATYIDQKRFYQETWAPKLAQSTINLQNSSIALNAQKVLNAGVERELMRARAHEAIAHAGLYGEQAEQAYQLTEKILQELDLNEYKFDASILNNVEKFYDLIGGKNNKIFRLTRAGFIDRDIDAYALPRVYKRRKK